MFATMMEIKIPKKETKVLNGALLVHELSILTLLELGIDSENGSLIEQEVKQELIKRGKDNIQTRILIKKECKKSIASLEALLNKLDTEEQTNKEVVKSFKSKFLNSVSILDKLQLEWQKYDLGLIK